MQYICLITFNIKNKKMENEITNKQKILIVLHESIKFGRASEFHYDSMYEKHKEVLWIQKLNETIKQKIKLFENLDESSTLFKSIYDCAKIALRKLQDDERYNYYSAELIMKFNQLETCFTKRLKPLGTRIVERTEKQNNEQIIIIDEHTNYIEKSENEIDVERELIEIQANIGQNVTGKKLQTKIKKKADLINALKTATFND